MHFHLLTILLFSLSFSALGNGRSPAVEDFVGIEVDHVESTPRGAESLFNLESDIQKVRQKEMDKQNAAPENEFTWNSFTVSAVATLIFLPMFACLFFMRRIRSHATIESASNIEVLEKYRKEREARNKQNNSQENKKAS